MAAGAWPMLPPIVSMIGTHVGQFVIQRQLGEGGMGAVYLAEHAALKTPRAIKLLLPQWTQDAQIVRRFIHEARAAASIRHRNIVEVHDCGQLASGEWFILLDYLNGCTLARFIQLQRQHGPISLRVALHVLCEIANGLQAAHDHQIVHRDLSPENIYLGARDGDPYRVTILDFGISRLGPLGPLGPLGALGPLGPLGPPRARRGTPAYMAPELLRGAPVGPAADIYALGVIAYQMTTGRLPFQDERTAAAAGEDAQAELDAAEIDHRRWTGLPIDPRRYRSGLGDAWVSAILAALDPDPAHRPASARAFGLRLAEALPGDGEAPPGIEIARTYARELFEPGDLDGAVRARRPTSRYQLGARLGVGGMAEVFAGTVVGAEGFARTVAIKRVLDVHSEIPAFAAMFIEEARLASLLSHPNVVSVFDFDRDPEGRLFLVMEYVDGKNLDTVLDHGRLPVPVAIYVVTEILRGLGYAHELPCPALGVHGVVHRDVSPHNVLVSWEGTVKVTDFGIAKAFDASEGARPGLVRGKPAYMSPEQVNAEVLDRRSDLFSVGILLWEMLAGCRLFTGTRRETFEKVLFAKIEPPSCMREDVPADLDAVAMKLLARPLGDRYDRAEHAIEDLARCADHPRNGRSELVQLMARRFSAEVKARALGAPGPARRLGGAARDAAPQDSTAGDSTAGDSMTGELRDPMAAAASQWLRAAPMRPRWSWIAAAAIVLGAVVGGVLRVVS